MRAAVPEIATVDVEQTDVLTYTQADYASTQTATEKRKTEYPRYRDVPLPLDNGPL